MKQKLFLALLLFFISLSYASGSSEDSYYAINVQEKLCGDFVKGTADSPNWMPHNWEAIFLYPKIENSFLENISCLESRIEKCCKSQGYRYAGVPIGIEYISEERKGAELLAAKKIIETKSFNPHAYNLSENISRKEVMKIIMNLSGVEIQDSCREIFIDVKSDWACKYIESALENNYIVGDAAFRPNDTITKTEAIKLIFKARGIEKAYNTDYWQEDYISSAYYYGYIDQKYKDYNQTATRGWIFSVAGKTFDEFERY